MSAPKDYKKAARDAFEQEGIESRMLRCGEQALSEFTEAINVCESPIEAKFLVALFEHCEFDHMIVRTGSSVPYFGCLKDRLEFCPQFNIGPYRCDFAFKMTHPNGTMTRIIVECDGHDFHERTKEQAQRDKSRDRYLQANDWKVLRFTGSELHRDAEGCVDEVATMIQYDTFADWKMVS